MNRPAVPRFDFLTEAAAQQAAVRSARRCFQRPEWVRAVSAARGRPHAMVAVKASWPEGREALLFGAVHRRYGAAVFESMPMGGYGGWVCEQGLALAEESVLTSQWLTRAPWAVVRLTSEPGRAASLPSAAVWPLPARLRSRFESRDFETHLLDLTGEDAVRLQRVRQNVRSYLRRVDALGYSFEIGGPGALADFCSWYRRGSQGWRSPADSLLPDKFFEELQGVGTMDIWRAIRDGQSVGAAAFLVGRAEVQYQASGAAKVAGPVSAMDALLWTAARHYRESGFRVMNLGASDGLDSVRRFKEKFGALPVGYRCVTYLMPRLASRVTRAPGPDVLS